MLKLFNKRNIEFLTLTDLYRKYFNGLDTRFHTPVLLKTYK